MRRLQFIELHEQRWFPSSIRDEATDALQYGLSLLKAYAPITTLLQRAVGSANSRSIVDLCSGGGGPWLDLSRKLKENAPDLSIWLTDKYPNLAAFKSLSEVSENRLSIYSSSVDAMEVPSVLPGFRTMFSTFHQFSPEEAAAVLQNAVDARQGIGIFEITRPAVSTISLMLPWALLPFVCTPWIRPFRWSRLVWTYLIPMIPFVLWFDGVVSCFRSYGLQDLREFVDHLTGAKYCWEIGECSSAWRGIRITYMVGYPYEKLNPDRRRAF